MEFESPVILSSSIKIDISQFFRFLDYNIRFSGKKIVLANSADDDEIMHLILQVSNQKKY